MIIVRWGRCEGCRERRRILWGKFYFNQCFDRRHQCLTMQCFLLTSQHAAQRRFRVFFYFLLISFYWTFFTFSVLHIATNTSGIRPSMQTLHKGRIPPSHESKLFTTFSTVLLATQVGLHRSYYRNHVDVFRLRRWRHQHVIAHPGDVGDLTAVLFAVQ